ncbi:MAG: hypothetical protein H6985_05810 [Pseudomonadales bacterium]|nr:hypothetical protein [Pseudomonadales bacterium]
MKMWFIALILAVPAAAADLSPEGPEKEHKIRGWQAAAPEEPVEPSEEDWVDSTHSYATEQAQALTQWMDEYFGEPNYELEAAESFLRLDFVTDWDQEDGNNNRVRLRGKIQVPRISKRLNIVFSDEGGDELDPEGEERKLDDSFGLLYRLSEGQHSRFDLTMGISWNRVRPGVRYRYQGALSDVSTYRFTQRLQYEDNEGGYATSQIELNRVLGPNTVLRWNNRAVYGEETDGTEWVSRLSLFKRHKTVSRNRELGVNYFGAINGVTDPESYVKNYRLGVLFRRQVFRRYMFLELEPAYNYRKQNPHEKRQFAWSVSLGLQIALERDLARKKNKGNPQGAVDNGGPGQHGAAAETGDGYQPDAGDPFADDGL